MGWQDAPVVQSASPAGQPAWAAAPVVGQSQEEKKKPGFMDILKAEVGTAAKMFPVQAGAAETAANTVSGMVASPASGLAGIASAASGGNAAQTVQNTQNAMTYQPRTQMGQNMTRALGVVPGLMAKGADIAGQKAADVTGSPAVGATVNTALQGLPTLLARRPGRVLGEQAAGAAREAAGRVAVRGEQEAAVRSAEQAPKNAKINDARALGIKIPPSEVSGAPVGKVLEGMSGKIQTEMSMSRDNAKAVNRTAGKEIGLSERQPMTEANIDRLKKKQFAVYDQVKKIGRVTSDDTFRSDLAKVRERTAQAEEDYPEDTNELIDKEIKKFDKPSADSSSMLEKIKSLRNRASRNMQSPDAEKFELGIAQKKIATAMEDQIDRHLQSGDYGGLSIEQFRAARQQLAKIYSVEDALSPNGNVSAAVLARQLKRGVPLSGGLKQIAEVYQEFPRVMRSVDGLGGHASFSALDYLVGGVEAVANPHKAAAIVGALAGRPVARAIIKSKPYQRAAIKAREPRPTLATQAARRIAGPKTLTLAEDAE